MFHYIIKKGLISFFSLFLVMSLTFFLMKAIPGDPFIQEQVISKEILQSLYSHYGLDQPIFVQYFKYVKGFFYWDFGPSFIYQGRTVNQVIKEGFPISAILGLEALSFSLFFGVLFGSIAAIYKGKWQDYLMMALAMVWISLPGFLLASFLQYFFSIKLGWLPVARWGSFSHTILPALSLAAMPSCFIARMVRMSLLDVLQQDYIKTAYSKGLNSLQVIYKHALRNAIIPVISYLGPLSAQVLTGSFVIEKIFGIPGLGKWLIMSISNRDYTMIMGITVFYSFFLISIILLVDIIYGLIDPRIRKAKRI